MVWRRFGIFLNQRMEERNGESGLAALVISKEKQKQKQRQKTSNSHGQKLKKW